MKRSLIAYAAVSALAIVAVAAGTQTLTRAATPSPSTTFASLTTIYVVSGVIDGGGPSGSGTASTIHCSNVSGQSAQVRVLALNTVGGVEGSSTQTVPHGGTQAFSTHATNIIDFPLETGNFQGVFNVESTESAVFCSAMTVDAATPSQGFALHMVRVNGHPGTVE
jgi:hypothetical protein